MFQGFPAPLAVGGLAEETTMGGEVGGGPCRYGGDRRLRYHHAPLPPVAEAPSLPKTGQGCFFEGRFRTRTRHGRPCRYGRAPLTPVPGL